MKGLREHLGVSKFGVVPDLNARQGIIPGQALIK